nr:helix-turn-helix domain-containing protein [uncultured Comamonas sp.]
MSRGLAAGKSLRSIAADLQVAASTVSREIARNDGAVAYRALKAESTPVFTCRALHY